MTEAVQYLYYKEQENSLYHGRITILFYLMNRTTSLLLQVSKVFQSMKPNPAYSSNYERMSGNCTRTVASQMLHNLNPPITSSSYILDNACGPGIVSEQIKRIHPDAKIMATDWSPSMVEETQNRIKTEGWRNIETGIEDVRDLRGLQDGTFSHAFTNLGMPVPGDDDSGVNITSALFRVLEVGGIALVSTWAGQKNLPGKDFANIKQIECG